MKAVMSQMQLFCVDCGHTHSLTHTKHIQHAGTDRGGDIWNSSMSSMKVIKTCESESGEKEREGEKSVVIPLSFSSSRSLILQTPSGMPEPQLRQTALTGMKVTVCLCVFHMSTSENIMMGILTDERSHNFTDPA